MNREPITRRLVPALSIAATAAPSAGFASAKETVTVGACVSWPRYAMIEVAQKKRLIPDCKLNITTLEDPLAGHAALAAGQIDVLGCTADYIPISIPISIASGLNEVNVACLNPS